MVVVGLEPERAPLDLLERVAVGDDDLGKVLADLRARPNLVEVVVVSTCLRTEVYAVVERFHDGVADLQAFIAERAGMPVEAVVDHLTVQFDDMVAHHVFEVASGLRSAVLGETEVLGQVRRAGARASAERAAGPVLTELFRRAVQAGRRVRTVTAIARGSLSLSHVAAELVAERFGGSAAGRRVVVVGAGEMGASVASALGRDGADVVVANRNVAKGRAAAEAAGGSAVGLEMLAAELERADAAVACSAASLPVLDGDLLTGVLAARGARPALVVVDLGMPRNVDPTLRGVAGLQLLDLDEIRTRADRAMAGRHAEIAAADAIIAAEVERYRSDVRVRGAAPAVAALRDHVEGLRTSAVARSRQRRSDLTDEQWEAVDRVTRDVIAQVLHQPTVALKDAAGTQRGERLVEALRALFDL